MTFLRHFGLCCLFAIAMAWVSSTAHATGGSFIGNKKVSFVASTVPANGDVNPYGVAIVQRSTGKLVQGHVLVSNFNNKDNLQGTGTTIVDIAPNGTRTLFAQIDASSLPGPCPGGVGLTTALVVLQKGWVVVGSLPTKNGMSATAKAGCLLVLNNQGQVMETFSGTLFNARINGPWDMAALDLGSVAELFVSNVLNGTVAAGGEIVKRGTVVRIILSIPENGMPQELLRTVIGSGFEERTDPNALVIGPTGVRLAENGTLYVADTLRNRIAAIPNAALRLTSAGQGLTVSIGEALNQPLGLDIAPNTDILTVNAGDGNIVETTPGGSQVKVKTIDTSGMGGGTLFGLAVSRGGTGVYFVDDGDNTLDFLH